MTPFELAEQNRLQELETVIESGLQSFMATGMALAEIRDRHLYRDKHKTWDEYTRKRWGLTKDHARRIIRAKDVVVELEKRPRGRFSAPNTEYQARPLTRLRNSEKRAKAWDMAVEATGNGNPTAAVVQAAVEELQEPKSSGNGGPLDPTLEVAWILEFLSAWTKKITEFENATKVGKFSPEAQRFIARRIDTHITRLHQW